MDITAKSRQRQLKSSTALPLQSTAPFNKSTSAIHLHQTADKSPTKPLWGPSQHPQHFPLYVDVHSFKLWTSPPSPDRNS